MKREIEDAKEWQTFDKALVRFMTINNFDNYFILTIFHSLNSMYIDTKTKNENLLKTPPNTLEST